MKKNSILKSILLILGIYVLYGLFNGLFAPRTVDADDNPAQDTIHYADYYITGTRNTRCGFDEVDATDQYLYVLSGAKVDAHDYQGNYQHTLVFTAQAQNGGTSMVCSPELLYVSTKDNKIHAFRGTEYLGTVTREEINHLPGMLNETGRIFMTRDGIYKTQEDGTGEFICPLPETLEKTMPVITLRAGTERAILAFFVLSFFAGMGCFIFKDFGKPKKQSLS